jgi:hypothetical protein
MSTTEPTTITVLSEDDDAHEVVFLGIERYEYGPYLRVDTCGEVLSAVEVRRLLITLSDALTIMEH